MVLGPIMSRHGRPVSRRPASVADCWPIFRARYFVKPWPSSRASRAFSFPFAQPVEEALGLVKFLDIPVPLFRKLLGLLLPLLPVAVRELLGGPEAVKLGRLREGRDRGILAPGGRPAFFQGLRASDRCCARGQAAFPALRVPGGICGRRQSRPSRPIELDVLQHLELSRGPRRASVPILSSG